MFEAQSPNDRVINGAAEAVEGYLDGTGQRNYAAALIYHTKATQLRLAVKTMLEAGVDPYAYALFVATKFRERKRKTPLPQQVFGARAVARWLPEYKRSPLAAADRATRELSADRLRAYAEHYKLGRFG